MLGSPDSFTVYLFALDKKNIKLHKGLKTMAKFFLATIEKADATCLTFAFDPQRLSLLTPK